MRYSYDSLSVTPYDSFVKKFGQVTKKSLCDFFNLYNSMFNHEGFAENKRKLNKNLYDKTWNKKNLLLTTKKL